MSVIAAVVFKLDPAAQFYTWFAGATTVGFVVLLIATAWRCSCTSPRTGAATRSGGYASRPLSAWSG